MSATQRVQILLSRLTGLGVATPQQLEQARQEHRNVQERFGAVLKRLGILRDAETGKRLASQLGWLPVRLEPLQIEPKVREKLPIEVCRLHRLVPVREGAEGSVIIASDDPLTVFTLEHLERRAGCPLDMVLVREADLDVLLGQLLQPAAPSAPALPSAPPQPPPPPRTAPPPPEPATKPSREAKAEVAVATADEPIIQLVDSLLSEAVRLRASDIHLEPLAALLRVRYRIDGVLHEVNTPPKALQGPVTSRLKILAGLNIAEKRLPQDGRIQITAEQKPLDIRVSVLPALHGESIVMRLLDRSRAVQGLEELGLADIDRRRWDDLIRRPYGMILVTGPTGSGKTTTLYATLAALNRPDRKLITVEDPVEYQLSGINQVNVKTAIGLSFAAGLRAMLRQAPDIIMVGEIRDAETAQVAIQAALTGHLVFSTLHTNDAPSAVTRLIDMGIAPFLVASTVQGIVAQRLVRRVCADCAARRAPTPEERVVLGEPPLEDVAEGRGCDVCHRSGYRGRVGMYELLQVSDALRHLIVAKSTASRLREQARREGMRTLRDDGLAKVRAGLTTVAEVLRATPDEAASA